MNTHTPSGFQRLGLVSLNLLIAFGYALVTKLTLGWFDSHDLFTIIWPLSGVELALLLLSRWRFVPGLFLGALLGNLWVGHPFLGALVISLGNILGSIASYEYLRKRSNFSIRFDRLEHFRQMIPAIVLGSAISALLGVGSRMLSYQLSFDYALGYNLLRWWQGVFLGYMLVTPLLLIWRQPSQRLWFKGALAWRTGEFVAFLCVLLLIGQIVYVGWWSDTFGVVARFYWLLLFVVWSAVRFGRHGTTLMLLISVLQGLTSVVLGVGDFAHDRELENLWLSYVMATLTGIALSLVIFERDDVEENLRTNEQLLQFALEGAGDAVWDWDLAARKVTHSSQWNVLLGYAVDENVGRWQDHIHPDDLPVAQANNDALMSGKSSSSVEMRLRCKDGSWKWLLSRGMVVSRTADGKPLRAVGTVSDITTFKENQKWLEHVAHYDALTGTPNRVLLSQHLEQAMQRSRQNDSTLVVAYLDLDGFKAVNDRHGHAVGDMLLVFIAQQIKAALRDTDMLARIGGDEFVVLLENLESAGACTPMIERLLAAAAMPVVVNELVLQVSVSIGITFYPHDASDADLLLRHADQAMYQAKQAGRNGYQFFDVEKAEAAQNQLQLINQVDQALQRNEFVLYYQPKVNMRTGELLGAEALARWQHPERGLLSPAAFLPAIEDPSLVIPFGEWAIKTALIQIEAWRALGHHISVSVNIAAYHLQQIDFVPRLMQLLSEHPGLEPGSLELEILETSTFENLAWLKEVMQRCQAIGVSFAIDDFGTGYSSLTYLRQLPVEVLKIDQSFVRGMLQDVEDAAIVAGVIGLGKAFSRQLMPEGVETIEHGLALLRQGCEAAQGYAIARPLPEEEFLRWSQTWRPDASWTQAI